MFCLLYSRHGTCTRSLGSRVDGELKSKVEICTRELNWIIQIEIYI